MKSRCVCFGSPVKTRVNWPVAGFAPVGVMDAVMQPLGPMLGVGSALQAALVAGGLISAFGMLNALVSDLVHPTSETARVIGAVAKELADGH